MINKYYSDKYDNNNFENKITDTKKAFKIFIDQVDPYLPVLVLGIGSNKYPSEFLKKGYDVRVVEDNLELIKRTREKTNDDGYIYLDTNFDKISKDINENSLSGIWIDNSLLFEDIESIKKYLKNMYYLLDDCGYIFLQRFVTIREENIYDVNIESNSKYKMEKIINNVNKSILSDINKGIDELLHKKIEDIESFEIYKYEERFDVKSFGKAIKLANIILRKK